MGMLKHLSYTRDNVGNITGITDHLDPAKTKSYTYDNLYRLTLATGQWGTITYTYDSTGNRTYETSDTGNTSYIYGTGTNRLTSSSGEKELNFNYDNAGNTTGENARQYMYNQNQRMIQVDEGSNILAEYIYNGNGQRIKKFTNNGMECTVYHYDKNGLLITESSGSGTIKNEYIYINGQPLAKIEGNYYYYYHNDHIGTPISISDDGQNVVWQGEYRPFGESYSVTGSVTNNLRFPGQYFDAETGLHYNYFRDYKPEIGRYVEVDPIGIQRGKNHLYVYVQNNPVKFNDPLGLLTCGSGWNEPFVPDNPFGYQFSHCCQQHDNCYGTCGSNKGQCDNDFEKCMVSSCENVPNVNRVHCRRLARIYSGAVKRYGGSAYGKAQEKNCDC
jgi:RHS repeat-associated protein